MLLHILTFLLQILFVTGTLYNNLQELTQKSTVHYDFVIVGAGAAGSVLANRLSENPNSSVLLVEAGGNHDSIQIQVPFFCTRLSNTLFDWNYTTVPQVGLGGRTVPFPRGHVLGGSTSINGMFYTRGSSDDFDRYARITKDPGWSWAAIQRYIRRNERFVAPADHHNTYGQYIPFLHGFRGTNFVSLPGFPQAIDDRVVQTTRDLHEFRFNQDMNSGTLLGLGWLQATVHGGRRSSSATSYLNPNIVRRDNLDILINTKATRVLSLTRDQAFRTVEVVQGEGAAHAIYIITYFLNIDSASKHVITARRDLILSAGTIGSPLILLNSGIGDRYELERIGIPSVHHLPDVGKNLSDHPRLASNWHASGLHSYDSINQNLTLSNELLSSWSNTQKGPLVDTFASQLYFARLHGAVNTANEDPASGPSSPHYELGFSNGFVGETPSTGSFIGITTRVVSPTSRTRGGSVTLQSQNPLDAPLIDPGFLKTDFDISTMREAVKTAMRFLDGPAWKDYVVRPVGSLANATNDDLLDSYIRSSTGTSAHCTGTSGMSARDSNFGVVDPDFKVKGLLGIRVVDGSVLPFTPSAHTQAPVYIFAERAADLIRAVNKY